MAREPAILPPGPCAQVNPLFRAAPSVDLLAGWHASKTGSRSSGRGNWDFFSIRRVLGSGDFQRSNCNCGEKCARGCSARPTPPLAVCKSGRPFLLLPLNICPGKGSQRRNVLLKKLANLTWDESLNMARVTLGRPRWKPHNGVICP